MEWKWDRGRVERWLDIDEGWEGWRENMRWEIDMMRGIQRGQDQSQSQVSFLVLTPKLLIEYKYCNKYKSVQVSKGVYTSWSIKQGLLHLRNPNGTTAYIQITLGTSGFNIFLGALGQITLSPGSLLSLLRFEVPNSSIWSNLMMFLTVIRCTGCSFWVSHTVEGKSD